MRDRWFEHNGAAAAVVLPLPNISAFTRVFDALGERVGVRGLQVGPLKAERFFA
jgi:hypothetical protein